MIPSFYSSFPVVLVYFIGPMMESAGGWGLGLVLIEVLLPLMKFLYLVSNFIP